MRYGYKNDKKLSDSQRCEILHHELIVFKKFQTYKQENWPVLKTQLSRFSFSVGNAIQVRNTLF